MTTLLSRQHQVVINTLAPKFIFQDELLDCDYRHSPLLDPGLIHKDAFTINVEQSLKQISEFLKEKNQKDVIQAEIEWLQSERIECVCLDAPFLPALAGKVGCFLKLFIEFFYYQKR